MSEDAEDVTPADGRSLITPHETELWQDFIHQRDSPGNVDK